MSLKQRSRTRPVAWERLSDDQLLSLRFCDLELSIAGTALQDAIERLYGELSMRGMRFRPHCWLAQEWFSPDGIPGIAIPFYLAHQRLISLERRLMREVEGGNRNWLMRILRHEAGHAVDSAYRLRRLKSWREAFGPASLPYPDTYRPRPGSRRFVQHLGAWYAQAHPTEDFAETFAVWLKPHSTWRREYVGWPAYAKLQYIDELAQEIGQQKPLIANRSTIEDVTHETGTLREHYEQKLAPLSAAAPLGRRRIAAQGIYDCAAHPRDAEGSQRVARIAHAAASADSALRGVQRVSGASGPAPDDRALRGVEPIRPRFTARAQGAAVVGRGAIGRIIRRTQVAAGRIVRAGP